ncbi:unnamed protein product [Polarella glacialis]|uniref:poly(ADP-ribose) glycohydrolase n=1 Tax=Polarella glacialis TaxID=89957 RepID=A0A813EHE0_POLGL|nr:unnamed protein product [Polarella glacialis]
MSSRPKVQFFHDTDGILWSRMLEALQRFAGQCELPDQHISMKDLVGGITSIRSLSSSSSAGQEEGTSLGALKAAAEETAAFYSAAVVQQTVAQLARWAGQLPALFPDGLPMLDQGVSPSSPLSLSLTRRQCAALLAASLFRALPPTDSQQAVCSGWLPDFDLSFVLARAKEKTLCLLCYFVRVTTSSEAYLNEVVSFARRSVDGQALGSDFWRAFLRDSPLGPAEISDGCIEHSWGNLQADFANKYLGGGALHGGNVQEEIRFAICPECFVGMLFCSKMLPNEAIYIVGTQQFSNYTGYGGSFRFSGPYQEQESIHRADARNRRGPCIVAFDALCHPGEKQYSEQLIIRELVKAFVACQGDPEENSGERQNGFATGNWGCGVFGGDPQLKSMIQWIAASAAGRDLVYHPFGDKRVDGLQAVIQALRSRKASCSDLYELLQGNRPNTTFQRILAADGNCTKL